MRLRMRSLLSVGLAGVLGAAASARAATPWMTDSEIRGAFSGRTIEGAYSDSMPFTESYFDTGRLDYIEPQRRMTGRWSVVESTFCTLYDNGGGGGCFKVRQVSGNCYEFYFAAFDEEDLAEGSDERPRWTARGWRKDVPSTCVAVPVV